MEEKGADDALRLAIREAIKNAGGAAAMATKSGIPFKTLEKYVALERMPSFAVALRIADSAGISIADLAGKQDNNDAVPPGNHDWGVRLPRYEIRAAAGPGSVALTESVSSYFTVEREWLRRMLPGWAAGNAQVGVLEGSGDSMEPTIRDGDLVMAVRDPPEFAVERGGVFLLLHHNHLRIKRLHVDMKSGDIALISDNARYPVEVVPMDRLEFDLKILAQIFFAGGRLRT